MTETRCACRDIGYGTYANAVDLEPPAALGYTRTPISVDACIAAEVQGLWALGIKTLASCCGHNRGEGVIAVLDKHDGAMTKLGYRRARGGWRAKYRRPDRGGAPVPGKVEEKGKP